MGRSFNPSGGGVTPFEGQEVLSSFTPPPLQSSVNNYLVNVRGFLNASLLAIGATAPVNVTGLAGWAANRELILTNPGASTVTYKNANGASLANNRFLFGADVALAQNEAIRIVGAISGGWLLQGAASSGGGGAPTTATYYTATDETAELPNSIQLVPVGAGVYATVNQAIANGTPTPLNFDTVLFDTGALWSNANPTRFTVPAAGLYVVTASCVWAAAAAGGCTLAIGINGAYSNRVSYNASAANSTLDVGNTVSVVLSLAANDYVEAISTQASGAALDTLAIERLIYFSVAALR